MNDEQRGLIQEFSEHFENPKDLGSLSPKVVHDWMWKRKKDVYRIFHINMSRWKPLETYNFMWVKFTEAFGQ